MAGNSFFLGGTDLAGVVLARIDEREAIGTYALLIEEMRARCGGEVASLFAEPIKGVNRITGEESVSWFCAIEGTPFSLRQLDAAGRQPVVDLLRQRLRSFASLLGDPRSGATFGSWLHVLSADSVMAVAGQPVIKNWGMVPSSVAGSEDARETHFRTTLGTHLPPIPTPPFLGIEAQSFASRVAQMADREAARASVAPPPPSPSAAIIEPAAPAAVARAPRPWLAPAVACLAAAAVLTTLLFGHLLRYPAAPADQEAAAIEAQRQTNQALRDQLERLNHGASNTCQAAPGTGPRGADATPLLPPLPSRTPVAVTEPGRAQPGVGTLAVLLEKATVLVLAGDSLGSGFFISDRHIVTNHHVVGDHREVRVGNRALGGLVAAKVVAMGAGVGRGTQDLAVIEIAPKAGTAVLRLGIVPERLEPLTAAGYPGAVLETIKNASAADLPEANFTQGILTSRQKQAPAGIGTIIHTAQIGHGNSGGPLVDAGGCVVGVNSWLSVDAQEKIVFSTYFQALDAAELRAFLTQNAVAFSGVETTCKPVTPPAAAPPPAPPAGGAGPLAPARP